MLEYEPISGLLKPPSDSESSFLEQAKRAFVQNHSDSVPGFDILEKIGQGGFAVVYLARQISLNRLVALKISTISPNLKRQARFQQESEILAKLHHPNVVAIYECGSAGRHYYFASEYCSGGSLANLIAGQVVPHFEAAHLVQSVALTMTEVHKQGIIHRDLKPSNLLVAGGSTASWRSLKIKVADFGLAHDDDGDDQTETGDSLGTPQYVAPEQLRNAKQATASADIYSLGAVLYELITGRPPHLAATMPEIILQVERAEVVAPHKLVSKVSKDLENICLKCLQKEPTDRYSRMEKLADDLGRFIRGEPVHARPLSLLRRTWRWGIKHPGIAMLSIFSVVLTFLFAALGLSYWKQTKQAELQQEVSNSQTYLRLITDIRNRTIKRPPGWRVQNLETLRRASLIDTSLRDELTLRNEMANSLIGYDLGTEQVYVSTLGEIFCIAGHPNKPLLAVGYAKADDHQSTVRTSTNVVDLVNSKDRKLVQQLRWPAHPGPFGELHKKDWDGIRSLAFSRDGHWLYIGTRAGHLYRQHLDSKQIPELMHRFPEGVCSINVSPDGQHLFLTSNFVPHRRTLWHVEARLGGKSSQWTAPNSIQTVSISHDGRYLVCCLSESLTVIDAGDFHEVTTMKADSVSSCYSPISNTIATLTYDLSGQPVRQDGKENTSNSSLKHSINAQPRLTLMQVPSLAVIKHLPLTNAAMQSQAMTTSLSFLPDGNHLAVFWPTIGRMAVYDISGGEEVATVELPELNCNMAVLPASGQIAMPTGNAATLFSPADSIFRPSPFNHRFLIDAKLSKDGRTLATFDPSSIRLWHQGEQASMAPFKTFVAASGSWQDGKQQSQSFIDVSATGDSVAWHYVHTRELTQWRKSDAGAPHTRSYSALADICFSANGNLYGVAENAVQLISSSTAMTKVVWRLPDQSENGKYELKAIAIGRRFFVVSTRTGRAYVLRQEDSSLETVGSWQIDNDDIQNLSICLQDKAVVLATKSGFLELRDLQNGVLQDRYSEKLKSVSSLDISSNGLCAAGGHDGSLWLFDISSSRFRILLSLQVPKPVKRVCLTEDGKHLMTLFAGDHAVRMLKIDELQKSFNSSQLGW